MVAKKGGSYSWYPPGEHEGRWIHPLHDEKECASEGCGKVGSWYFSGEGPFCREHFGRRVKEAREKAPRRPG